MESSDQRFREGMCFVEGCRHFRGFAECEFYHFPSEPYEYNIWISLINNASNKKGMVPQKTSRVCSCHFVDGDASKEPSLFPTTRKRVYESDDSPAKMIRYTESDSNSEDSDDDDSFEQSFKKQPNSALDNNKQSNSAIDLPKLLDSAINKQKQPDLAVEKHVLQHLAVDEPKPLNSNVYENEQPNSAVDEPKPLKSGVYKNKQPNSAVDKPKPLNSNVYENKQPNSAVDKPKPLNSGVYENKQPNSAVDKHEQQHLAADKPNPLNSAVYENKQPNSAVDIHKQQNTAVDNHKQPNSSTEKEVLLDPPHHIIKTTSKLRPLSQEEKMQIKSLKPFSGKVLINWEQEMEIIEPTKSLKNDSTKPVQNSVHLSEKSIHDLVNSITARNNYCRNLHKMEQSKTKSINAKNNYCRNLREMEESKTKILKKLHSPDALASPIYKGTPEVEIVDEGSPYFIISTDDSMQVISNISQYAVYTCRSNADEKTKNASTPCENIVHITEKTSTKSVVTQTVITYGHCDMLHDDFSTHRPPSPPKPSKKDVQNQQIISEQEFQIEELKRQILILEDKNSNLKKKVLDFDLVCEKADTLKHYTGIPDKELALLLCELFSYVTERDLDLAAQQMSDKSFRGVRLGKITIQNQLLVILIKLRHNSTSLDLSFRFHVTLYTILQIFRSWPHTICNTLNNYGVKNMDKRVEDSIFDFIIGFYDVYTAHPGKEKGDKKNETSEIGSGISHKNVRQRHRTMRGMIVLNSKGFIVFASNLYPLTDSEDYIFMNCGFTKVLKHGDSIVRARTVSISSSVIPYGVKLSISEVTARNMTDRAYKYLQGSNILNYIPFSLLHSIDSIWKSCCYLYNFTLKNVDDIYEYYGEPLQSNLEPLVELEIDDGSRASSNSQPETSPNQPQSKSNHPNKFQSSTSRAKPSNPETDQAVKTIIFSDDQFYSI